MFKAGYIALVGRPNAGKSTLINALVGEKVAITSPKPQTTRDNILGIVTTEDYQMVFVDTPGVHKSKNSLDKAMMKNLRSALAGVDIVLYLIDASKEVDEQERSYIDNLSVPKIVVKTKCDLSKQNDYPAHVEISALSGKNINSLIDKILELLPQYQEKYYLYDKDYYTDKSVKFLIGEELREKALLSLHQEIPHGVAVEIIRFYEGDNLVEIDADIICENDRHKGIIIGKGGINLKNMGAKTRECAQNLLGKKVMLKIFVRVENDWRNKPEKVKHLGY